MAVDTTRNYSLATDDEEYLENWRRGLYPGESIDDEEDEVEEPPEDDEENDVLGEGVDEYEPA
jgi:hypothetical protein